MPDKAWKALERYVAALLGTKRVGPAGDDGADVYSEHFVAQCKLRKSVPKWLTDAMCNAMSNTNGHQLPIVVLKKSGRIQTYDEMMVIMPMRDWNKMRILWEAWANKEGNSE